MMGLGKPKLGTKFEVVSFSSYRNTKGKAQNFFWWDFMMDLGKPQLLSKFEVAGFIHYRSITKFVCKQQIRFSNHHMGELG